jgi:AraC-like DNA-binding protein
MKGGGRLPDASSWQRISIEGIEDLKDAVYGARLEATQMSRTRLTGSIIFAARDDVLYGSGHIGGRVALLGPLSQDRLTLGVGLHMAPGTRHWLSEVETGTIGVFAAGDEHDALYGPGSLYATATLTTDRLEEMAAEAGFDLDARTIGGTRIEGRRFAATELASLETRFRQAHLDGHGLPTGPTALGGQMLGMFIRRLGRPPRVALPLDRTGLARVVARARTYVREHLDQPLSVEAIAAAAFTSHRTLHRAFQVVLDETPYSYVLRLRLHRIRYAILSDQEKSATITAVANTWGISELGRFAGWYRDLFGELPSETLRRARESAASGQGEYKLARSA